MAVNAVIFDIGNVLIEWQPERFYDAQIGEARRRQMFAEVDLHGMNDLVDLGHNFTETIYETAEKYPDWRDEIRMWHDRWIELATPVIDHSVRLMAALQANGVPVFSLTNFGIQSYDYAATHYPFLRAFDRDFISGHMGGARICLPARMGGRIVWWPKDCLARRRRHEHSVHSF